MGVIDWCVAVAVPVALFAWLIFDANKELTHDERIELLESQAVEQQLEIESIRDQLANISEWIERQDEDWLDEDDDDDEAWTAEDFEEG